MKLPRTVKVGPFLYRVRSGKQARRVLDEQQPSGLCGMCVPALQEILVRPLIGRDYAAETLLHEILHACWDQTPMREMDGDVEESVVAALSPLLFGVLRDNPELVRCLTDA